MTSWIGAAHGSFLPLARRHAGRGEVHGAEGPSAPAVGGFCGAEGPAAPAVGDSMVPLAPRHRSLGESTVPSARRHPSQPQNAQVGAVMLIRHDRDASGGRTSWRVERSLCSR